MTFRMECSKAVTYLVLPILHLVILNCLGLLSPHAVMKIVYNLHMLIYDKLQHIYMCLVIPDASVC